MHIKHLAPTLFVVLTMMYIPQTIANPIGRGIDTVTATLGAPLPEAANRTGSKRHGGSNSKGKGSTYKGGRSK